MASTFGCSWSRWMLWTAFFWWSCRPSPLGCHDEESRSLHTTRSWCWNEYIYSARTGVLGDFTSSRFSIPDLHMSRKEVLQTGRLVACSQARQLCGSRVAISRISAGAYMVPIFLYGASLKCSSKCLADSVAGMIWFLKVTGKCPWGHSEKSTRTDLVSLIHIFHRFDQEAMRLIACWSLCAAISMEIKWNRTA